MARKQSFDEINFEKFSGRRRKPRGRQSIRQLSLLAEEPGRLDYEQTFRDGDLQSLYENGLINELLAEIKSGKEATVYLARGDHGLLAVKMYRDAELRSFGNDQLYREGRAIVDKRLRRAITGNTRKGRSARQGMWVAEEYSKLCKLHAAGLACPRPLAIAGRTIAMEFIGEDGDPAPRLADVSLSPPEAEQAFAQCMELVACMLACDCVHSDLSAFNILWHKQRAIVIDFPQMADFHLHPRAWYLLWRDVENLCASFARLGLIREAENVMELVNERARVLRWQQKSDGNS